MPYPTVKSYNKILIQKSRAYGSGFFVLVSLVINDVSNNHSTVVNYSTVTDFARLRGWSTLHPRMIAMW